MNQPVDPSVYFLYKIYIELSLNDEIYSTLYIQVSASVLASRITGNFDISSLPYCHSNTWW